MTTWISLKRLPGWLMLLAVYGFLYMPILVFFIFSFNKAAFPAPWKGFTLDWYRELWLDTDVLQAFGNSLVVALSAVTLSAILGVLLVFYIIQRQYVNYMVSQFYINLIFPEIVLAVGILNFFIFLGIPLGMGSLIVGHTVLGLGYVVPLVYARYGELDKSLLEAARDLGATPMQSFFRIILPLLKPAIVAASILVFIISFDDFILAYFCAGATFETLPLHIFSMLRSGVSPVVNALSTILLVLSSILILLYSSLKSRTKVV